MSLSLTLGSFYRLEAGLVQVVGLLGSSQQLEKQPADDGEDSHERRDVGEYRTGNEMLWGRGGNVH